MGFFDSGPNDSRVKWFGRSENTGSAKSRREGIRKQAKRAQELAIQKEKKKKADSGKKSRKNFREW